MAVNPEVEVRFEAAVPAAFLFKWKVKPGSKVSQGTILLLYDERQPSEANASSLKKMKATMVGTVLELLKTEGDAIHPGCPVLIMRGCSHPIVMKDMCAECGADLREYGCKQEQKSGKASVAMVHSIPELVVSQEQAQVLGKADEVRLLKHKKLVLLVDLDQTLIHTTNDDIPANLKDVHHFQLDGGQSPWYHSRLRPGTQAFLEKVSKQFELHICTFGARTYAHTIARFLDKDGRYFSHRILSRDECFNPNSKTANLSALFPCGDNLVCIIDDREDVWNYAPNLVHVKPYRFFQHTGDINAPPGLSKNEKDSDDESKFFAGKRVKRVKLRSQPGKILDAAGNKEARSSEKLPADAKHPMSESRSEASTGEPVGAESQPGTEDCARLVSPAEQSGAESGTTPATGICDGRSGVGAKAERSAKWMSDDEVAEVVQGMVKIVASSAEDRDSATMEQGPELPLSVVPEASSTGITPFQDRENGHKPANDVADKAEDGDGATVEHQGSKLPTDEVVEASSTNITPSQDLENGQEPTKNVADTAEGGDCAAMEQDGPELSSSKVPEARSPDIMPSQSQENVPVAPGLSENGISHVEDAEEDLVDVEDNDDYLLYLSEILETIHRRFYEEYAKRTPGEIPDLKKVIPQVRRKVLTGVRMVFSSIVPTNLALEKSRAYHVARSLGADIQPNLVLRTRDNKHLATTHVVAARRGTIKVNEAKRSRDIHVVSPDWLWCCADRWEWVSEHLFPLTKDTVVDQKLAVPETARALRQKSPVDALARPSQPQVEVFPTYDPVTGKRINKASAVVSGKASVRPAAPKASAGDAPPDFASSFNPLMSFSSEDIASMDQEVEDLLDSPDSDEEEEDDKNRSSAAHGAEAVDKDLSSATGGGDADGKDLSSAACKRDADDKDLSSSSSSSYSLTGDRPHGWGRGCRKRKMDSDGEGCADPDTESDGDGEYERPKYPRCELPRDSEKSDSEPDSDDFADSIGSVDEEMAAAVEREFLGM